MRLHELNQLVQDAKAAFDRTDLVALYEEAIESARSFNTDPDLEIRNVLKSQLGNIERAASAFDPESGSKIRTKLSRELGFRTVFGPENKEFIEGLQETSIEARGIILQKLQQQVNKVIELHEIVDGLALGLSHIQTELPNTSQANIRIAFEEAAALKGLDQLATASAHWKEAFDGFAGLLKTEATSVELVTAEAGSTVFGVEASGDLEMLLTRTVAWVQTGIRDVLEIRSLYSKIHEIKSDLALPEIDVDSEFESRVEPFIEELMDGHDWGKRDKDYAQVQDGLRESLRTVFKFIGSGGRIEFTEEMPTDFHKEIARGFNQLEELQAVRA